MPRPPFLQIPLHEIEDCIFNNDEISKTRIVSIIRNRYNFRSRRIDLEKTCIWCNKDYQNKNEKFCSLKCRKAHNLKDNRLNGVITRKGYRKIWSRGKYVFEHRLVMESFLGRELTIEEEVHHRNRDRLDNRIENLEVLGRRDHRRAHRKVQNLTI